MILEFWLNLFLKSRESENVFFAQNGKETGENERFWPKMGEIGGYIDPKMPADHFFGLICPMHIYSMYYH